MPRLSGTFGFYCSFLHLPPSLLFFFLAILHITRALQLYTLQYTLQASHLLLTSSLLAALSSFLNRTMGFENLVFFSFLTQTFQTSLERLFPHLCFSSNDCPEVIRPPEERPHSSTMNITQVVILILRLSGNSAHQYVILKVDPLPF